jgi:glutamine synthetase
MVRDLAHAGYEMKATFELEFYLFNESYDSIRRKKYRNLQGVSATSLANIYLLRNAYHAAPFMKEVIKRLEWKGIAWEGWNDEGGVGQVELNLEPTSPVTAADTVVRAKQILYEVAVDMGLAVTFMSKPGQGFGNGMHIHHSLAKDGTPVFFDPSSDDRRSVVMHHWLAGLIETLPGAVSFLCPTINSFRRMTDFSAVPTTPDWGEQNKSTAIRTISGSEESSRIEYRIGAGDLNPYLALAVIIAGGLAGLDRQLPIPAEFTGLAWGLPDDHPRLPNTIMKAAAATSQCQALKQRLGEDFVSYWTKTRELEWLSFHTEGGDPASKVPTRWEFDRYFALI